MNGTCLSLNHHAVGVHLLASRCALANVSATARLPIVTNNVFARITGIATSRAVNAMR
jgi:hypothetical protein